MNILTAPGKKLFLSGDEAVARAALEKRVDVATGYPGNPSTKVITALLPISRQYEIIVEWSTNEKVALEVASGAAWAGRRSLVTMKMSGINVIADSLLSISHSGVTGALVIYAVDDVGVYYGMVEQDSRYYAMLASLPLLMPSTPEEAYTMTLRAFQVSEQIGAPVFVLSTTAVADAITAIRVGQIEQSQKPTARFQRNPAKFTKATSQWSREQHRDAIKRLERAGELFRTFPEINSISLPPKNQHVAASRIGLIVAGASYAYIQEVFRRTPTYSTQLALFKLGSVYPLPQAELHDFLLCVDSVLVLEELEPIIETHILALVAEAGLQVKVLGKRNGLLPRVGDYTMELVEKAVRVAIGDGSSVALPKTATTNSSNEASNITALPRTAEFCPGCPHRTTYYALQHTIEQLGFDQDEVIVTGDIGCTIIGVHSPLNVCWTEVSMGASIGIAQGFKYAGIDKPVVAAMGDGTFYHNGVAGLLNAVQSGVNLTLIILDNSTSAMTGLQPDAGSGRRANGEPSTQADIAMIAHGCGVTYVKELNPYHLPSMIEELQQAIVYPNVAVVIAKAPCTTQGVLINKQPVQVKQDICLAGTDCQDTPCYSKVGCPSVLLHKDAVKISISIDTSTCVSCGLCVTACPFGAILPIKE
ncbi:MAG TPA: indolepyruvate ferredoxin oxidoreductase subunit alpha [Ktedonobacteraceae bacterium]|jgi:indolepyruvate ferredoxin oxidoreductase alpha subunit